MSAAGHLQFRDYDERSLPLCREESRARVWAPRNAQLDFKRPNPRTSALLRLRQRRGYLIRSLSTAMTFALLAMMQMLNYTKSVWATNGDPDESSEALGDMIWKWAGESCHSVGMGNRRTIAMVRQSCI